MNRAMTLSKKAEKELRSLARSAALKKDMATMAASRHNPFFNAGIVDADAYILLSPDSMSSSTMNQNSSYT